MLPCQVKLDLTVRALLPVTELARQRDRARLTPTLRRDRPCRLPERLRDACLNDQFAPELVERRTDSAGSRAVPRVEHAAHHLHANAKAPCEAAPYKAHGVLR